MGLFSGILGAVGSFFGPVGTAVGGAVGGAIDGDSARSSANHAADSQNAFNAQQAQLNRDFNADQAGIARAFNADQAVQQRTWESEALHEAENFNEYMASTQYQRGVQDMAKAGLNPMLAYKNGGDAPASVSAPTGTAASAAAASSGGMASSADRIAAVQTALQATKLGQDMRESDSRIALNRAQANREGFSAQNLEAQTQDVLWKLNNVAPEQMHLLRAQEGNTVYDSVLKIAQKELLDIEKGVKTQSIDVMQAQVRYQNVQTLLGNLAVPQARNMAGAQDSWWMQHIAPYLNSINSAGHVVDGSMLLLRGR